MVNRVSVGFIIRQCHELKCANAGEFAVILNNLVNTTKRTTKKTGTCFSIQNLQFLPIK